MEWIATTDKLHPDKPGELRYEQVPCLIVRNCEILIRQWNCEHLVWDTEDGDDFYCKAEDVTHWMPLPAAPNHTENNMTADEQEIKKAIIGMAAKAASELLALDENALAATWFWRWDKNASVEWNTCEFNDDLEAYKRRCRGWEEHHNGGGCVVERVRSKYLMPRVREFLAALAAHTECDGINCNRDKDDEDMTCGDCDHLCGEECGHHGREVNADDLACDYFVSAST